MILQMSRMAHVAWHPRLRWRAGNYCKTGDNNFHVVAVVAVAAAVVVVAAVA